MTVGLSLGGREQKSVLTRVRCRREPAGTSSDLNCDMIYPPRLQLPN